MRKFRVFFRGNNTGAKLSYSVSHNGRLTIERLIQLATNGVREQAREPVTLRHYFDEPASV